MSRFPDVLPITPARAVRGEVRVPGSKSHTNRSLVIAALADGPSSLEGALFADDTLAMMEGLGALGFSVEADCPARRVGVEGLGGRIPVREAAVDARDAGTVMRFLTAVAALGRGRYVVDGSERMRERPIGDLVQGLRGLGVEVRATEREGFPPVEVRAHGLAGGTARVSAATSSQFASALLLASPCAASPVAVELTGDVVSRPFIELTLSLMAEFGAEIERPSDRTIRVAAPRPYRAGNHCVQGDATAASYFWAAAALTGGRVEVANVGTRSQQGDAGFVDILEEMGCTVTRSPDSIAVEGRQRLRSGSFDLGNMPDTVPTLAVAALFADGPVEITNVANLRVKECDRLAALAAELPKFGAEVEQLPDGLKITPASGGREALELNLLPVRIATYDDHRMAMSFAVAGLAAGGVEIGNPACVEKTYPDFFDDLQKLAEDSSEGRPQAPEGGGRES